MNHTALALFASLILFGWTSLAAGVIATFAGQPGFSSHAHRHVVVPSESAPLVAAAPR